MDKNVLLIFKQFLIEVSVEFFVYQYLKTYLTIAKLEILKYNIFANLYLMNS